MADFSDVINKLRENDANDVVRNEELKETIIAASKTTNRSFGQSLYHL